MTATPRFRRWIRSTLSLRTLFVLITLVATWLGYHINCIHQRRAMQAWALKIEGSVIEINLSIAGLFESRYVPWYRRWLRDRALGLIVLPDDAHIDGTPQSDDQRAVRLFPEAEVACCG